MRRCGILPVLLGAATALGADPPTQSWKPIGRISRDVLRETSGVVESRRHPGIFWTHGDSGTDPRLIAVDAHGSVVAQVTVAEAPNTDWEDICADEVGHLYIGDIGNSSGLFPARYVYTLDEPDPRSPPDRAVPVVARRCFKYPQGHRFNGESLFHHAGKLYVLPRTVGTTIVYRLEPVSEADAELTPVVTLNVSSATGADVSREGNRLLICTPTCAWVFPLTDDERFVDQANRRCVTYPRDGSIEAGCFAGRDVVVVGEDGAVYRITAEQVEKQVRFTKP